MLLLVSNIEIMQISLVILWLIIIIIITAYSIRHMKQIIKTRKYSPRILFKDFGQKMWMTVGIGVLFFGFYVGLVLLGSYLVNPERRLDIFFLVYKHPVEFIYLGLLLFACITVSTYLVRMLIKYLYNSHGK